eukprot:COSAG06_NODE_3307_length_5528_cov_105.042918_4_plen_269_part_00
MTGDAAGKRSSGRRISLSKAVEQAQAKDGPSKLPVEAKKVEAETKPVEDTESEREPVAADGSSDGGGQHQHEGDEEVGSGAVGTWSKDAPTPGGLPDGAAVEWAYKSAEASQFDLLYLYGFVSAHPAHAFFPLRMEWAASSPAEAKRALALFEKASAENKKEEGQEGEGRGRAGPVSAELLQSAGNALALTLKFRADGRSKSHHQHGCPSESAAPALLLLLSLPITARFVPIDTNYTMRLLLIGQNRSIFIGSLALFWIYVDRIIANA